MISDYRLKSWLQFKIQELAPKDFKNLRKCGHGVFPLAQKSAVYVMSNGSKARLFGAMTCGNTWACPTCTATIMSHHANNIRCLNEAFKQENKVSFMTTYTIPHLNFMSAECVYNLLLKVWFRFSKDSLHKKVKIHTLADGTKTRYLVDKCPYGKFLNSLEIKYYVKATEFTWGRNGWHPHFHVIYWVPKSKANDVLKYEEMLRDYWWKCIESVYAKELKNFYPNNHELILTNVLRDTNKELHHKGVYISKNEYGLLTDASARYVAGWDSASEISKQQLKTAQTGHYSPFQLLYKAYEIRDNESESNKLLALFFEYAKATYKKNRINYSKGLKSIIVKFKMTQKYHELIVKKNMETGFQMVCWFKKQDWLLLSAWNQTNYKILPKILDLARCFQTEEIKKLLDEINITAHFTPDEFSNLALSIINKNDNTFAA